MPGASSQKEDAVAVRGDRIAAVGLGSVREFIGPNTRVIDAGGGLVVPGFQDAHVRTCFAGLNRRRVWLSVEVIRILTLVPDSAVKHRTAGLNQIKDLRIIAPASRRKQLDGMTLPAIAKLVRTFRPEPSRLAAPTQVTETAEKEPQVLVQNTAPTPISCYGIGTHYAAREVFNALKADLIIP